LIGNDLQGHTMRTLLLAVSLSAAPVFAVLAEPRSSSERDVGFVEAPQPHRLVLLANVSLAPTAKKQHAALVEELRCDNRLSRKQWSDAALPFRWETDWAGKIEKSWQFNPVSGAVKVEVKELLDTPPLPEDEQKAREKTFDDLIATVKELNEPHRHNAADPFIPVLQDSPRLGPSIIASPAVALVLLGVGAVGWMGLGIGAYFLERRNRATDC
jgi:hypothetical protein